MDVGPLDGRSTPLVGKTVMAITDPDIHAGYIHEG